MKKSFWLASVLLMAQGVHADRIARMDPHALCTYTAQVKLAAYRFFEQGKARAEVSIEWQGDETPEEIDFVNDTLTQAYAWLANWKQSSNEMLPAASFADMVYQACMREKDS